MNDKPRRLTHATLPLLKARVIERSDRHFTIGFGPEYGSPTRIRVTPPNMSAFDIREGDLLTLYTDVLFAERKEEANGR